MNRSLFFSWTSYKKIVKKTYILNFGPQHPAAHGVLRLILQLEGEVIQRLDPHIGLLHRGTERLIETKPYLQAIPYFDRLDYVSMMTQEHAFCLAIEKLTDIDIVSRKLNLVRILFDELTRLLNHFLAIACHALDIGSMSSVFWGFEEREKLMEFYERVCGARMHAAFHRPAFQFSAQISTSFLLDILAFVRNCFITLNEMHNVLTFNKIWRQRLVNIGSLQVRDCVNWGLTGVLARSVGLRRDLRLNLFESYSGYNTLSFRSFLGVNGDSFDRYLIRMLEMGESLSIINKVALSLYKSFSRLSVLNLQDYLFTQQVKDKSANSYSSMEDLINHFIYWHSGILVNRNINLTYIESPKGEFGVGLVSNKTTKPARCKIRSPSYFNLQALGKLTKGHYLADLAALIGTIDIVFGEVDR